MLDIALGLYLSDKAIVKFLAAVVSLAHDMSGELTSEMSGLSGTLVSGMTRCGHEADERSRRGLRGFGL